MNVLHTVVRFAEDNAEFDPNKVTPGFEGFIFTGIMAAAVIVLGFLLVSRLRRNSYRAEVREQIEHELSGAEGDKGVPDSDPNTSSDPEIDPQK